MTLLEHALDLASKGYHVFPLIPNGKIPTSFMKDYPNRATRDPKQIRDWWIDPVLETEQPYNIGVSTTRFGDDEALVVVDVDNKEGKNGDGTVLKLELEGKDFPPTYTQETPTGGRHFFYRTKVAINQRKPGYLGEGLDIRSYGGYVVGRGSIVSAGTYKNRSAAPAPVPTWIVEQCGKFDPKERSSSEEVVEVNQVQATARGIHFLKSEAGIATSGERNHKGYTTAAKLRGFGLDRDNCLMLMMEYWQCEPMLEQKEIEHVVNSAYQYAKGFQGETAPEAEFQDLTIKKEPVEKSYLEKLNDEYALIYLEGSHFIFHETKDEKGRAKSVPLTEATFKRRFSPYTVQGDGKAKPRTFAEIWLDWKGRREYQGVCFAPERPPQNGYYNLWTGFACKPISPKSATEDQKAGLQMFLDHARENICNGKEDLFNWLIGYFAHMIQKPFERPLTTLVFKGKKGVGKNALIDRVGNLLGKRHYLVAHDGRYLTSNFNGHLDSCLMLVLDEAFWSGDKAAEGKLKGLTTAPEILIERKGKEPYTVDNLVRLVVIGNDQWIIPASEDERRYAVFQVGEGKKQNREYFFRMRTLLDLRGGNGLLLNYLKTFDLSQVDINAAPQTDALLDQKISSLDPVKQWWLDCLTEGYIMGGDLGEEWPEEIAKERFRAAYRHYIKERQVRSRIPEARTFGRMIKSAIPSIDSKSKKREGESLVNTYRLPPLKQARREWDKFIGHPSEWEVVD